MDRKTFYNEIQEGNIIEQLICSNIYIYIYIYQQAMLFSNFFFFLKGNNIVLDYCQGSIAWETLVINVKSKGIITYGKMRVLQVENTDGPSLFSYFHWIIVQKKKEKVYKCINIHPWSLSSTFWLL